MNVGKLQLEIHTLYEGDIDYPSNVSDEDFQIRLALINLAIREWENAPNVAWNELKEWLSDDLSTTGERFIHAGQNRYACPNTFAKTSEGVIYVNDLEIVEIPIDKRRSYEKSNSSIFYVSGNLSSGFFINLLNVDTGKLNEAAINYQFIKQAKTMVVAADIPECSDHNYITHRVVSELYAQDSDPKATKELVMSQTLLSGMITRNAVISAHGDNTYDVVE